jgi:hypothetical protein
VVEVVNTAGAVGSVDAVWLMHLKLFERLSCWSC